MQTPPVNADAGQVAESVAKTATSDKCRRLEWYGAKRFTDRWTFLVQCRQDLPMNVNQIPLGKIAREESFINGGQNPLFLGYLRSAVKL